MAQVKYHGEFPEGREEIVQHGYTFERGGKSVSVDDAALLARFSTNRFFEVSDEGADDSVRRGPGRPRKETKED